MDCGEEVCETRFCSEDVETRKQVCFQREERHIERRTSQANRMRGQVGLTFQMRVFFLEMEHGTLLQHSDFN